VNLKTNAGIIKVAVLLEGKTVRLEPRLRVGNVHGYLCAAGKGRAGGKREDMQDFGDYTLGVGT
jgi:hypothetical protein